MCAIEVGVAWLTAMVSKPRWLHVEWRANVEDVRVTALKQVRDAQLGP